jgi:Ca2+-binding RTX toxin-like protein
MAFPPATTGDDLIFSTNDPTDIINGLSGDDTVSYAFSTAVNVSLSIAGPQSTGGSGIDTLISIENIIGSNFNDTLQGDAGNNVLNGGLGSDFVSYSSAAGSVTIDLGGIATGAAGFDTLISIENAIGSNFADTIIGNAFNNVIASGGGNDYIVASLGSDVIDGGFGTDAVSYTTFTGPITLGAFGVVTKSPGVTDQLNSVETIVATSSNQDTIDLSLATAPAAVSTTVNLAGSLNNVQVNLSGGAPAINLTVSQFENVIGSGVVDTITGNSLANNLSGNGGNDTIAGGIGNDTIAGGLGNDTLTGNADNDFFVFGNIGVTNRDTITDYFAVQDTIMLTNSLDSTLAGALANGIKGLAFVGGNVAGNVLSSAFFFKGNGFTGIGAGFATGIYVDTTGAGNIYYNDSTAAGSFIFASVGSAAATLTNADFVYAGGPSFSPISPIRTIPISSDFAGLEVAETTTLDTANLSKFDTANLSKFDTANLSALDTANLSAFDTANLSTRVFAV